jgi:hypothetical protein
MDSSTGQSAARLLHLPLPLARLAVVLPTLVVAEGVLRWIHLVGITSPLSGA